MTSWLVFFSFSVHTVNCGAINRLLCIFLNHVYLVTGVFIMVQGLYTPRPSALGLVVIEHLLQMITHGFCDRSSVDDWPFQSGVSVVEE